MRNAYDVGLLAQGMALAFVCDAASFLLSAWTLARVEVRWQAQPAGPNGHPNVFKLVGEGLRFCWNDVSLRTSFLSFAAIAFFIGGPMQVALPVIANQMDHGAAAFGWLMGAHGAGTLAGDAVATDDDSVAFFDDGFCCGGDGRIEHADG